MKRIAACSVLLALSVFIVPFVRAQSQGMGGMDTKSEKKGTSQSHKASGMVTKVDPEKGSVTIAHGPVESMSWPAMTMTFQVKDQKILDKVKQGEKVDFSFVQSGKNYTITQMK